MIDNPNSIIIYKHYEETITIESKGSDLAMGDFVDLCRRLALAVGYHPKTVEEWFENE